MTLIGKNKLKNISKSANIFEEAQYPLPIFSTVVLQYEAFILKCFCLSKIIFMKSKDRFYEKQQPNILAYTNKEIQCLDSCFDYELKLQLWCLLKNSLRHIYKHISFCKLFNTKLYQFVYILMGVFKAISQATTDANEKRLRIWLRSLQYYNGASQKAKAVKFRRIQFSLTHCSSSP